MIWQTDPAILTDVNATGRNTIPPDRGALLVGFPGAELRIDPQRPEIVLGRADACDVRVDDRYASRRHAVIALRRTRVYLIDQSSNGTFVRRATGEVEHVFRGELVLEGEGEISLGRAFDQDRVTAIGFRRDRRALYRV